MSEIAPHEWAAIVRNVPVVSVDLVLLTDDGIVLGKRTNAPAKGEWFVPGGMVFKHESLTEAVRRVARQEVGTDVSIDRQLGVYEHHYDSAATDGCDSKHYIAIGYVVHPDGPVVAADDQHTRVETFPAPGGELDLHPYVRQYVDDVPELPLPTPS